MVETPQATIGHPGRTMLVTSVAVFMVSLDQLVVTTALPQIRTRLHTGIQGLEWTVNAYTLTFAVFLLGAASLADRFGRRRLFAVGMVIFTAASALAAIAPGIGTLIAARSIQGLGAAIVLPLTLTMLSAATPPEKRGAAIGVWGGIAGLAVALGPVVGGVVIDSGSWQWIFWLNVPIGIVLLALSRSWLAESHGPHDRLDMIGTVLVSLGMFGLVYAIVGGSSAGWTSARTLGIGAMGLALIGGFIAWQGRAAAPILPLRLFRNRTFSAVNVLSLLMFFGMFGSIFLVMQFLQTGLGESPMAAGVRMLAWTGMVLFAAPLGGGLSDKIGGKPIVFVGLALQAAGLLWLALSVRVGMHYTALVLPFMLNGIGMGLYYGPSGNLVMGAVDRAEEGIASGANNAMRELGGVLGVAVMASVFAAHGGFESPERYVHGLGYALWIGVGAVALGALSTLAVPRAVAAAPPAVAMPLTAVNR